MSDSQQEKSIKRSLAAIEAIRNGGMVIMVDDEERENEGDLVFAADDVCAEKVNFMVKEARGLLCLPMSPENIERLRLPMMGDHGKSSTPLATAFTVSIEARDGVTTGISAADRCRTIQVAIDPASTEHDLVVPGHVFPLKAKPGGVLERAGHTEGSVDLARLAGKSSNAVICEIMKDDGTMARLPDLETFAEKFSLPIVTIEDLITFRLLRDTLVVETKRLEVDTGYGVFTGVWFQNSVDGSNHFALVKGSKFGNELVDVRVHRQRPIIDVFSRNPENDRIRYGLEMLRDVDRGVLVYLGSGGEEFSMDGDFNELSGESYNGQKAQRLHGIGAQILRHLEVKKMRIHAGVKRSLVGLGGFGLEVEDMVLMDTTKGNS